MEGFAAMGILTRMTENSASSGQGHGPLDLAGVFRLQAEPQGQAVGEGHRRQLAAGLQLHLHLGEGLLPAASQQASLVQGQLQNAARTLQGGCQPGEPGGTDLGYSGFGQPGQFFRGSKFT